jgi:hypothetical protein
MNSPGWLLAVVALASACAGGSPRRMLMGGADVNVERQMSAVTEPPRSIWVADFSVAENAIKPGSGLIAGVEQQVMQRGGILGGGILGRRMEADQPTAQDVVDALADAITEGLNQQGLGFPAQRLPAGAAPPQSGWLVEGQFVSVDPGNRAERAVVGFGAGEATTSVNTRVDRLGPDGPVPILVLGVGADSGKSPGAVVTMNPYVAAAKFVLGRNATHRDVVSMGHEIAKQIASFARSRGVAPGQR